MPINRCVCFDVRFAELKAYAQQHLGCDVAELRERFGCTRGCGLCLPYVQAMLETGRTSFSPLENPRVAPSKAASAGLPDYEQALLAALEQIRPLGRIEQVSLESAGGRVIAEQVIADRDLPPFNRAQMDGYAIRASELGRIKEWRVAGSIAAGAPADLRVPPGHCVAIATGAPLPDDVDAVIQHELSDRGDRNGRPVRFTIDSISAGHAVHQRGADARAGATLIESGVILSAHHLGIAAAVGNSKLKVAAKPRAIVLTSGDEVVRIGKPVKSHQIRNSNGPQVCELLRRFGADPIESHHLPDARDATIKAFAKAIAKCDLLITVGGVSAGERDHFPAAFESARVATSLQGASIQPGRPIYVGRAPNGTIVVGLPGNPVSALACACLFVWPIVRILVGLSADLSWCQVELAEPVKPNLHRRAFRPAMLQTDGRAVVPSWAGSGDLAHTAPTHGLIELPVQTAQVQAGARLRFLPWP